MSNYEFGLLEMFESSSRSEVYREFGKRVFDIALTLLVLPIVLPVVAILALLVALDGGNPFHSQYRLGKNGRLYRMWKLRTMTKGADKGLVHRRGREAVNNPNLMANSWHTELGDFLRQSSLDELPLFFNVLIGDMSLVGPQPMMVSQMALYPGRDYCDLRPGLTGLRQISTPPYMTLSECAACDTRYSQILSFGGDLKILAATIKTVLRPS